MEPTSPENEACPGFPGPFWRGQSHARPQALGSHVCSWDRRMEAEDAEGQRTEDRGGPGSFTVIPAGGPGQMQAWAVPLHRTSCAARQRRMVHGFESLPCFFCISDLLACCPTLSSPPCCPTRRSDTRYGVFSPVPSTLCDASWVSPHSCQF